MKFVKRFFLIKLKTDFNFKSIYFNFTFYTINLNDAFKFR